MTTIDSLKHHSLNPAYNSGLKPQHSDSAQDFGSIFEAKSAPTSIQTDFKSGDLDQAARQMEVQMVTFMLKTMDQAGGNGGLLGSSSEGMGYFKDQFFENMAREMVESQGLGFAESLKNTYEPNRLSTGGSSLFKLGSQTSDKHQ